MSSLIMSIRKCLSLLFVTSALFGCCDDVYKNEPHNNYFVEGVYVSDEEIILESITTIQRRGGGYFLTISFYNGSEEDLSVPASVFDRSDFFIYDVIKNNDKPIDDKRVDIYYDPGVRRKLSSGYVPFPSNSKFEKEFSISDVYNIEEDVLYRVEYYTSEFLENEKTILHFVSKPIYFTVSDESIKVFGQ